MNLDTVVSNRDAFKNFSSDIKNGLNHAYLLICEDKILRERFLYMCVQKIFCPTMCGECSVCRAIDEGTFLDVAFFDGSKMRVADANTLCEKALIRPIMGDKKIFVIDNADKLPPQVQNKLLKTYEEPPIFLTVILASSSENGILTTIKSRAKKLYCNSFTPKEITSYLVDDGVDMARANMASAIGNGSLEKAEMFLHSDVFFNLYNDCFDLMMNLDSSTRLPEYVLKDMFLKDNISLTFDILELILSDVMTLTSSSGLPLKNDGMEYDLKLIAKKYSTQSAGMALTAINEGRKKLNSNVSPVSCAENVLFNILEARYKWH